MKIFVSGLDDEVGDHDLKKRFHKYGDVFGWIVRDRETGLSLGYALLEMADDYAARIAIKQLKGSFCKRRRLKVKARPNERECMYIFVANLSKRANEVDVEQEFCYHGTVDSVKIWVDRQAKSRRFAIVRMPNHHKAKQAIEMLDGKKFFGRKLWVERASEAFAILPTSFVEASRNLGSYRKFRV